MAPAGTEPKTIAYMENQYFFYRTNNCLKQLFLDEIICLVTYDSYTHFYINGTKVIVRISLDDAMRLLPKDKFIRVNRSVAVAVRAIDRVTRGNVYMRTEPEEDFPISKQYYPAFIRQIVILQTNPNRGRKKKEPWEKLEE